MVNDVYPVSNGHFGTVVVVGVVVEVVFVVVGVVVVGVVVVVVGIVVVVEVVVGVVLLQYPQIFGQKTACLASLQCLGSHSMPS